MAETLSERLRQIAREKARNANFARASYCAGRAGCEELKNIRDKPEDYIEWRAADAIERKDKALEQIAGGHFDGISTLAVNREWHAIATKFQEIARAALSSPEPASALPQDECGR